ncbi:MAG TPA: hypothetical protein PL096_10175 [Micropepsaceae bacterium]|nr:hypothetical protein [Micropepsaceae bacterium]
MPVRTALDFARMMFDLGWASTEYVTKLVSEPWLRQLAKRGDGSLPVLTLPGFSGPEISLSPLNRFLTAQGFPAESWGLGTNRGPNQDRFVEKLAHLMGEKLDRMAQRHGSKVALVGQSLGGIYAREIARTHRKYVDRVITLGSPAYMHPQRMHQLNRTVNVAMQFYTGRTSHEALNHFGHEQLHPAPPGVPLVSIFSPYDGVVGQDLTAIPHSDLTFEKGAPRENIEIVASHCGMAVNPVVLLAICDRLTTDPHDWQKFDARKYLPTMMKFIAPIFYPDAHARRMTQTKAEGKKGQRGFAMGLAPV